MNDYRALLNSTEEYLQALKDMGVQHLTVRREILTDLSQPMRLATAVRSPVPTAHGVNGLPKVVEKQAVPVVEPREEPQAQVAAEPLPAGSKEEAMAAIRERAAACVKCPHLVKSRKNVVFGVGDIHSPLMFVGEAPGADEDAQGEPFVGAAGQLLTRIIKTMGFSRETVYIANILKCRPDTPGQSFGNRKPTGDEMKTCLPYLLAQIEIIRPKVIVALGGTALEGLLGRVEGITKLRGGFLQFRDIPLMPTFHPSYLLRNQAQAEKRKVWEDMLQVLERLGAPISEKQRGYFLPAMAA
jgi:DNA polymerase